MHIKKLFDYSVPLTAAATIITIGGIIMVSIIAYTLLDIAKVGDSVVVTGSARETVESDRARFTLRIETRTDVNGQEAGYARIATATENITKHLTDHGFTEFEVLAITSDINYMFPQFGEPIMVGYTVSRSIIVRSSNVDGVVALANNIEPFRGEGYNVRTDAIEFTYSNLNETRVRLLTNAIADAKARAEAIAVETGRVVGNLRTASSGVVQVLPVDGVEISDYGSYDTRSRTKDVMVTVRATFSL